MKRFIVTVLSALVVLFATVAANDKAGELKLQQAIDLIESKGDLAKATPLLESVATSPDRALAARGLLCLARAQERYGQADAQKTYARLVNDFADQPTVVAEARAAMAGAAAQGQLSLRLLWQGLQWQTAQLSPDGSAVAFVDMTGDLGVRNVPTGAVRMLTKGPEDEPWTQFAGGPVWSPDGRKVAYHWFRDDETPDEFEEVRIADVASGRVSAVPETRGAGMNPVDWSKDGRRLLVTSRPTPGSNYEYSWIQIADGARNPIKVQFDQETTAWLGEPIRLITTKGHVSPDGRYIVFPLRGAMFVVPSTGGTAARIATGNVSIGWTADGSFVFTKGTEIQLLRMTNGAPAGDPVSIQTGVFPANVSPSSYTVSRTGQLLFRRRNPSDPELLVSRRDEGSSPWSTGEALVRSAGRIGIPLVWSADGQRLLYGLRADGKNLLGVAGSEGKPIRLVPGVGTGPMMSAVWSSASDVLIERTQTTTLEGATRTERAYYRLNLDTGESSVATAVLQSATDSGSDSTTSFVGVSPDGRTTYRRISYRSGIVSVSAVDETSGVAKELFRSEQRAGLFAGPLSRDGRWLPISVGPTPRQILLLPAAGGTPRAVCDIPGLADGLVWSAHETSLLFVQAVGAAERRMASVWECSLAGGGPKPLGIQAPNISAIAAHPDGRIIAYIAAPQPTDDVFILENFLAKGGSARR